MSSKTPCIHIGLLVGDKVRQEFAIAASVNAIKQTALMEILFGVHQVPEFIQSHFVQRTSSSD